MASSSRREFLSQAAWAAAVAGVGPRIAFAEPFLPRVQSKRPYLDLAIRCARWIDRSTQEQPSGLAWPADPLRPAPVSLDSYNGMAGVVYFFANLHHATGDSRWRDRAQKGGEYLVAESERGLDRMNAGLYTGLAGLGATLVALSDLKVGANWDEAARRVLARIGQKARRSGDQVEWSASNDIISGTAGTGLFLIQAAGRWRAKEPADLAIAAGRRLLAAGVPAEGGRMWFPAGSGGAAANYPNFSHGTSGVAYFLATLYEQTKEKAFLDGALAGARYLEAVATRHADGGRAIFHVSGGGENRFYLSWCHGPVGTARLFWRLYRTTGEPRWLEWVGDLTKWLLASGAPEQQSEGYWNNVSQCCGNVGIGQYWIDLSRAQPKGIAQDFAALRDRVIKNTLSRATDEGDGLKWTQAENRVSPQNLVAQTGFMQGAAGVGTFFLQLDALERGVTWPTPWPDTPWVG
jgi:lantibiotic modifying enzyme